MRRILAIAIAFLLVAIIVLGFVLVQILQKAGVGGFGTSTPTTTITAIVPTTTTVATGMPRVQGAQIVDAKGHTFVLRGAQIESPFNVINRWQSSERPTTTLNSATFNAMHDWHMNALRLPLSNWIYAKYTSDYMSQLDQVIQQANAAGLYVVLDLHDDNKAGSPYGTNATFPKVEDLDFWKAIATHYKDNPMVMFDVYNEPKTPPSWNAWLHGVSGTKEIGFQNLIDGIRSVGAKQIIVVEPGSAGGGTNTAEGGGWSSFNVTINDPDIIYSLHVYDGIVFNTQQQDSKWGPILNHHPLYYGEWAFLPNAFGNSHCQNLPTDPTQANQVVANFLNYMAARNASWTAWAFTPHHLVQDFTSYAPTILNTPWQCGNTKADVGMGEDVKNYLLMGHI